MGNPLRFFGADHPIDIDGVTIPPRCAVEVTVRTHQQRLLLRPDREATELLLGCLGRAYDRYPSMNLAAVHAMSNHCTFLAIPASAFVCSSFMRDFLSAAAGRLNDHRNRDGTFWERRYRAIPIADQPALEDRFRYVLTQGTKENLVWRARDWPGLTSIPTLLGGPPLVGRWRDHTAEYEPRRQRARRIARAAARGETLALPRTPQIWREYPIPLVPLPHWQSLPVGARRARVAALLADDDLRTRERHQRDGTHPLGVHAVLAADPFARPSASKRSPAPRCHASSATVRRAFRVAYRRFVHCLRAGVPAVANAIPATGVPWGATVPALHLVSSPPDRATSRVLVIASGGRPTGTGPPGSD